MKRNILIYLIFILSIGLSSLFMYSPIPYDLKSNVEENTLKINSINKYNISIISDGYNEIFWNNGNSNTPKIVIDNNNFTHVVWYDYTEGIWGIDIEIMYASYDGSEWSNATVISDGYNGIFWNDGISYSPNIAVDSNDSLYVVFPTKILDNMFVSTSEKKVLYTAKIFKSPCYFSSAICG